MERDKVFEQIKVLDNWFKQNQYKGYDPYDLFDVPLFHKLITTKYILIRKINRKILSWIIFLFPNVIIKLFNKKPNVNAKGMGLVLKGKCNLYNITNEKEYLEDAIEIAEWLIENRSENLNGFGWGYPFDWSGSKFIPKNTPSSVVSTVIGDGFFSLYQITRDNKYLDVCDKICVFLTKDLNIDYVSEDKVCFSYTPIDNNHVINANLFATEFLYRIGKVLNKSEYIATSQKAINYTLEQQEVNGDFLYWGKEDKKRLRYSLSNSDHYHTGFELRMLYKLWRLSNDFRIKDSLDKYFKFYTINFINIDSSINITPNKKYPINIHACSEVLICNSLIGKDFNSNKMQIDSIYEWISNTMLGKCGLYYYEIRNIFGIKIKNRFKFNRWAQSWMYLALTEYYSVNYEK